MKVIKPLTNKEIQEFKPELKQYKKGDGKGLYIMILPNSKKYFFIEFKQYNKIKRVKLGDYPELSLKEARKRRDEILQNIKDNIDPLTNKNDFLVSTIFLKVLDIHEKTIKRKSNLRPFKNIFLDDLKDVDIRDLKAHKIFDILKKVEKQGYKTKTRAVFNAFERIYNFCSYLEIFDETKKINFKHSFISYKTTHYSFYSDLKSLSIFLKTLDDLLLTHPFILALKFLVYSGLRSHNIFNLKKDFINFDKKIITFPAECMKTKKVFKLPLTKQLEELIYLAMKLNNSDIIFYNNKIIKKELVKKFNAFTKRHQKRLNLLITPHGFRATLSTICYEYQNEHKQNSDIIERLLSHKIGNQIRQSYDHSENIQNLRILLVWYDDFLDNLKTKY